jgi:hypothetical protein
MAAQAQDGRTTLTLMKKTSIRKRLAVALAAAVLCVGSARVQAADFFQWGNPAGTTTPYSLAPQLTDATANAVVASFNAQLAANPSAILAVQVPAGTTLSPATINQVFNNYNVKYIFADYEGPNAITQTTTLVNQIAAVPTHTGPSFAAGTSFIGNYNLGPIASDPTTPGGSTYTSGNSNANPFPGPNDFRNTGVNMATESLYPGDSSFRNPVNGTNPATGGSNAPNIRSALFTLPIQRLSLATQNLGAGQANIPYITRFNNFSNPALSNGMVLVNGSMQNGFNTAGSTINGLTVAGQLLSRDDFQALTLHYRMRGASGYQLLDPGVMGYTNSQYQSDAQVGWTNSLVDSVLSTNNGRVATLPTVVTFNGVRQTIEQAGVVWSAVTNDNTASPGLAILVSNMSNTPGTVNFNTRINGATLSFTTGTLAAGSHTILRFTKSGGIWSSPLVDPSFNDPLLASRDGIGIPEPASLSLLGIGALGVLGRRRRRA